MNNGSNCSICSKFLTGKQTLFCSIQCKNVAHQSYPAQKKRGLERKLYFVNKLDVRSLSNRKIGPILAEVAKCELLCHNCHAEVHNPDLDLAKLLIEPTALTTELPPLNAP